jgi:hypothetical protein
LKPPPLSSRIQEKTSWAEACFEKYGPGLRADPGLTSLLDKLRRDIHASHKEMKDAGVVEICRECDREEGGSCCGAGIEDRYDVWLLLINLLLGARLPRSRTQAGSCHFLGSNGCLLPARHVLCVNYVCQRIRDGVRPERMGLLREKEGEELQSLFLLKERIKKAVAEMEREA